MASPIGLLRLQKKILLTLVYVYNAIKSWESIFKFASEYVTYATMATGEKKENPIYVYL